MNFRRALFLVVTVLLVVAASGVTRADDDPLAYNDPGMHFRPPDGWERVPIENPDHSEKAPLAVFVFKKSKYDQRIITITAESFAGSLDAFEVSHAGDLRKQGDSTFIEKQDKTALANGMPAYWLKVNTSGTAGQFLRRYEYVVIDLTRGIVVSFFGRAGDFDEKEAKMALSSLYVVVYPRKARQ